MTKKPLTIYQKLADMAGEYADGQMDAFYTDSFVEHMEREFPNLTNHPEKPQTLYVQRFPNGTFGTKIFWSRVPGMDLVEFTQSEQ